MKGLKGQVLILFALGMVVLLCAAALAIDGGQLFTERRLSQKAADNAAMNGARSLANHHADYSAGVENDILAEVNKLAQDNGIDLGAGGIHAVDANVEAYFLDTNSSVVGARIGTNGGVPTTAVGVRVTVKSETNSFLAQIMGQPTVGAPGSADAMYYQALNIEQSPGAGLMPIGIPEDMAKGLQPFTPWDPQNGYYHSSADKGILNFGYGAVTDDDGNADPPGYQNDPVYDSLNKPKATEYCIENGFGGRIGIGNNIEAYNGDLGSNVANSLRDYIDAHPQYDGNGKYGIVFFPIFRYPLTESDEENGTVHVIGFCAFKIYYNDIHGSSASGFFDSWVDPDAIPTSPGVPQEYLGPIAIRLTK